MRRKKVKLISDGPEDLALSDPFFLANLTLRGEMVTERQNGGKELQAVENHLCEHEGCQNEGLPYEIPRDTDKPIDAELEYEYFCFVHSFQHGYCPGCGQFWGGCEAFDFSPSHLCPNCKDDLRVELEDHDELGA